MIERAHRKGKKNNTEGKKKKRTIIFTFKLHRKRTYLKEFNSVKRHWRLTKQTKFCVN